MPVVRQYVDLDGGSRDLEAPELVATIYTKAAQALAANTTFLGVASPSAAQVAAQVKLLTREVNGLLRLLVHQLGDGSDL